MMKGQGQGVLGRFRGASYAGRRSIVVHHGLGDAVKNQANPHSGREEHGVPAGSRIGG